LGQRAGELPEARAILRLRRINPAYISKNRYLTSSHLVPTGPRYQHPEDHEGDRANKQGEAAQVMAFMNLLHQLRWTYPSG